MWKARSPGEMVLLSPQLQLPRTSLLTAGDLPSLWHTGMGPSHGYLFSVGQHHPGESSSASLLPGAFQHRGEGLSLPSSPGCSSLACQLLLGQWHTDHPIAQGASGNGGARRRGILGRALVLPQQHSGPLHIQEKRWDSTTFSLQAEPQPIFHYGPLAPLCCASVVSTDSSKPGRPGPKLRLADSSTLACWLLPGDTFPAFMTPSRPLYPLMLEWHTGLR